jgi:hypothetical protein
LYLSGVLKIPDWDRYSLFSNNIENSNHLQIAISRFALSTIGKSHKGASHELSAERPSTLPLDFTRGGERVEPLRALRLSKG